ncbi:hypothetical protein [Nitrobacter sp. JJSN]|uniref:hypothetical protein n=1 Tax=Nitrobacter sp. JJSN TaxID=3453033 RepID=UPI003F7769D8
MCDYSLHHVSSRPAKVADKLVTMELARSKARGFAAVGELGSKLVIHDSPPEMAVCLLPGTELAFDDDVQYDRTFHFSLFGTRIFGKAHVDHKVASFRQVDTNDPYVQHDALEFPDGQVLKINRLVPGQIAKVLQLPVAAPHDEHEHVGARPAVHDSRLVLDRASARSGIASILVPSESTVMLWDTLRGTAIRLQGALAQSFQRLTAHKQHLEAALPADIDADFQSGMPMATLSKKSADQRPEEKAKVKSAA